MAYTKAGGRAVAKYVKANYARISITIPKAQKQALEAHAKARGESINGLVNTLLREDMGLSESEWKHSPVEAPSDE